METGRVPMVGLVARDPSATTSTTGLALRTEDCLGLEMREVLAPPAQVLAASLARRTWR